jgi:hypothetical protein
MLLGPDTGEQTYPLKAVFRGAAALLGIQYQTHWLAVRAAPVAPPLDKPLFNNDYGGIALRRFDRFFPNGTKLRRMSK